MSHRSSELCFKCSDWPGNARIGRYVASDQGHIPDAELVSVLLGSNSCVATISARAKKLGDKLHKDALCVDRYLNKSSMI